jgi:hypothetical protein
MLTRDRIVVLGSLLKQLLSLIAAVLAALTFVVQVFVAGRHVARPLLENCSLP